MAEIPRTSFQGPLAPKIGLNDSIKNPIPAGPKIKLPGRNYSHFIPVAALGLALLILPLTIQQLSVQQDVRQQASEPTPTIALPTSVVSSPTPSVPALVPPVSTSSGTIEEIKNEGTIENNKIPITTKSKNSRSNR